MKGSDLLGHETILFSTSVDGFRLVISQSMVLQWALILIFAIVSYLLTRNFKRIPGKRQAVLETIVTSLKNFVVDTLGSNHKDLTVYTGALITFLLLMNLTGIFGISPITSDYNIALGMGLVTFVMVQAYAIKTNGIGGYLCSYGKPIFIMIPFNMLDKVILPVSLSLRLFGNMTAGVVIMDLIYSALRSVTWGAQIGLPILGHLYFDLFEGVIQMVVFMMLSIVNIKVASEE